MTIQLIQGDCLQIMPTLEAGSVDAIITDLPYGTTACKWDSVIPFAPMWEVVKHVLKPKGAFVTTASQPFTSLLIGSNLGWFKYEWIWKKNKGLGFQHAQNMPMKKHENILVFSASSMGHASILKDKRMTYNPIGCFETGKINTVEKSKHGKLLGARPNQVGKNYKERSGFPQSILDIPSTQENYHPTQKPVALYEYLIRTYTNESETVLDMTMGSGTTGVACANTGREFIGIEQDADYFAIAEKRIAEAQKQMKMFSEVA